MEKEDFDGILAGLDTPSNGTVDPRVVQICLSPAMCLAARG